MTTVVVVDGIVVVVDDVVVDALVLVSAGTVVDAGGGVVGGAVVGGGLVGGAVVGGDVVGGGVWARAGPAFVVTTTAVAVTSAVATRPAFITDRWPMLVAAGSVRRPGLISASGRRGEHRWWIRRAGEKQSAWESNRMVGTVFD